MSRLCLILGLTLVLAACTSVRQAKNAPAESWRMTGKLVLQTPAASRVLSIAWIQTDDQSDIRLSGPLGVGVATIAASPDEVIVDTGDEISRYRPGDELMTTGLGALQLPWHALVWWVRGWEDATRTPLPAAGVRNGDWVFTVQQTDAEGPRQMLLEHPEVRLRLKVRQWSWQG